MDNTNNRAQTLWEEEWVAQALTMVVEATAVSEVEQGPHRAEGEIADKAVDLFRAATNSEKI